MLGLKLKLIQRVSSIALYIKGNNYYSVPGSVVTGPVVLICQLGEVKVDSSCSKLRLFSNKFIYFYFFY